MRLFTACFGMREMNVYKVVIKAETHEEVLKKLVDGDYGDLELVETEDYHIDTQGGVFVSCDGDEKTFRKKKHPISVPVWRDEKGKMVNVEVEDEDG